MNRVYYGEYTLRYWIELLISDNLALPEYQRTFVWDKLQINDFFKSINKGSFIPPLTIGCYTKGNHRNIILDGQQRLTSLLLGYLSLFPNSEKFRGPEIDYADDNDDVEEDDRPVLGWTFTELIRGYQNNTIESIKKRNENNPEYESFCVDVDISDSFLDNHYLGFSYIIPSSDEAQKVFANAFKDINTLGNRLTLLESRKSMYYIVDGNEQFFDPKFCYKIVVNNGFKPEKIDFVRYLSFAFQYKKCGSFDQLVRNYGKNYEKYYMAFIASVIDGEDSATFAECSKEQRERISQLKITVEQLGLYNKKLLSIIDADVYMFGLVYHVIVEQKNIDLSKKEELFNTLDELIDEYKSKEDYKKNPSALMNLRPRLRNSYEVYKGYLI